MQISGQCHCGAISFTATVEEPKAVVCHCNDCQQFSGAPFRAVLPIEAGFVSLSGEPKQYVKTAESGTRRAQAFCPECGTQLYAADPVSPTVLSFRLGCINERAELLPTVQLWGQSAMPWLHSLSAIPTHTKGIASELMDAPTA